MNSADHGAFLVIEDLSVAMKEKIVLDGFSLGVGRGEIHALVGDEPARRALLLKVIAGELPLLGGEMRLEGRLLRNHNPRKALSLGIEIIDSSPRGFLSLSVLENVYSERLRRRGQKAIDKRTARGRAEQLFSQLGFKIDLDALLSSLYPAEAKLVEIARSIFATPRLLLIDESAIDEIRPGLRPDIIEKLYHVFSLLASGGATILSSSNDMDQLFRFADRVSVIKGGSVFKTLLLPETDKMQLVEMTYSFLLSRRALENSNYELFYLKQIYENILNSVGFPLLVTDTKRHVIIANRSAEKLLGRSLEGLAAEGLHDILGMTERQLDDAVRDLHSMSRARIEYLPDTLPGTEIIIFAVLDEAASYMGLLIVFSKVGSDFDVGREIKSNTERYNSEQRIIKTVHEIKNPLGIILNYLRLIGSEESRSRIQDNVLNIEHEVQRISRLLSQLGGKRAEQSTQKPSGLSVAGIIDEIETLLVPAIEQNGITFHNRCSTDLVLPYDPDLLRQVVLNVMINAIDAMPGGGTLTVSGGICLRNAREFLLLEVTDSGVGIPEENLGKIFQPFFTTKEDNGSSGVGLSISKEIVENLGGFFEVQSTLGAGSTFQIFIPTQVIVPA